MSSVILASQSTFRAQALRNAGVVFEVVPSDLDEAIIKAEEKAGGATAAEVALALAMAKAVAVAEHHPGAFVIGADQMLVCGDSWLDKPRGLAEARDSLLALRGRTHKLFSAVCVAQGSQIVWKHVDHAEMRMRPFSDVFLDNYLQQMGERLCLDRSVGAYQLDSPGLQLFDAIEGDYFSILGLPMLPLLSELRDLGALPN